MKKTEILEEIKKLAPVINANLKALEREGYSESSFAYDRMEKLRFDAHSFINKAGEFRMSSKLNKQQLEKELHHLKKLSNYKSISPEGIRASNRKAFKSFNQNIREWNETHGKDEQIPVFTNKMYAKLKYMFKENQNIGSIISSDTIVELASMTTKREGEVLFNFLQNLENSEKELRKFMDAKKKDKSITASKWIKERGKAKNGNKQTKHSRKRK